MGTELRQQYDLLAEGAQERTRSDSVNDVVGNLQQNKKYRLIWNFIKPSKKHISFEHHKSLSKKYE
jgi:hypothetical protein